MKLSHRVQGFTLIEMLLSVACIAIILGISLPSYNLLLSTNDLDNATNATVGSFRRAQVLSQTSSGDTTWGVYVATGSILIYKGGSYASRDVSYDEVEAISSSISITGLKDITFSKMYGLPNATGTTILTSVKNETRTITINKKGIVDY
ncbi:prepilin-type N-terminal cleavage/methylation domain-containing protein [Candidatus Gracilibacteria bacterium]|nr:prepilin-type N-terminal cleavage/methylation domain-containing protein [Candidatus Gracilibacteria bacterium]MCF7898739.1 prepilin-type N-terminal cleavage/methylation domain-containing protein [Candidatus Paceibacterota bacterium]